MCLDPRSIDREITTHMGPCRPAGIRLRTNHLDRHTCGFNVDLINTCGIYRRSVQVDATTTYRQCSGHRSRTLSKRRTCVGGHVVIYLCLHVRDLNVNPCQANELGVRQRVAVSEGRSRERTNVNRHSFIDVDSGRATDFRFTTGGTYVHRDGSSSCRVGKGIIRGGGRHAQCHIGVDICAGTQIRRDVALDFGKCEGIKVHGDRNGQIFGQSVRNQRQDHAIQAEDRRFQDDSGGVSIFISRVGRNVNGFGGDPTINMSSCVRVDDG